MSQGGCKEPAATLAQPQACIPLPQFPPSTALQSSVVQPQLGFWIPPQDKNPLLEQGFCFTNHLPEFQHRTAPWPKSHLVEEIFFC